MWSGERGETPRGTEARKWAQGDELPRLQVIAEGIQILVKQVSLFTPEFEHKLAALKSDEARASEMEHAIRSEIHVKLEEDPAFYSSLRERLRLPRSACRGPILLAATSCGCWGILRRSR